MSDNQAATSENKVETKVEAKVDSKIEPEKLFLAMILKSINELKNHIDYLIMVEQGDIKRIKSDQANPDLVVLNLRRHIDSLFPNQI